MAPRRAPSVDHNNWRLIRNMVSVSAPNLPARGHLGGRDFVQRAKDLREYLLEEQAAVEKRTRYSHETFLKIRDLGFFRMLQPRIFGGHEIDLVSYMETAIELARGCPSTAWCTIVAADHPHTLATYYPLEVQKEMFGSDCNFIAPLVGGSRGLTTEREDGGWRVNGTWVFSSGSPYATHFQGFLALPANEILPDADQGDTSPVSALMTIRDNWEMLEDWGDLIGLKGSGSNSVKVTDAFVPDRYVVPFDIFPNVAEGTVGYRIYNNPLFAVPFKCVGSLALASLSVGMAAGMFDEFGNILKTRKKTTMSLNTSVLPTAEFWSDDVIFQQAYGIAQSKIDAARATVAETARRIEELAADAVERGATFGTREILKFYGQGLVAADLAWEAAEIMFKNGSSSAARDGQRLQRFWRDISAFRSNGLHQLDHHAVSIARSSFGLAANIF